MRIIIGLILTLTAAAHADGPGEARTSLLTYAELTQLSPEKRVTYLRNVADLLATMESQVERKYDIAAVERVRAQRSMIARWIEIADLLPDAAAEEPESKPSAAPPAAPLIAPPNQPPVKRTWADVPARLKQKVMGTNPGPNVAPPAEGTPTKDIGKEAVKEPAKAPAATAAKEPAKTPAAPAVKEPAKEPAPVADAAKEPAKGAESGTGRLRRRRSRQAAAAAAEPAKPPAKGDANCSSKPFSCTPAKGAERDKLIAQFRGSPDNQQCISGGFFTKKDSSRKAGTCELTRDFFVAPAKFDPEHPEAGTPKSMNCRARPNEVLCNPVVFCLKTATGIPRSVCVPSGQNITQECRRRYKRIVDGKEVGTQAKRALASTSAKEAKPGKEAKSVKVAKAGKDAKPVEEAKAVKEAKSTKPAKEGGAEKLLACDPLEIDIPAVRNEYKLVKEETEKHYRSLCVSESTFSKLFCAECKIIGEQLKLTLKDAGHACDTPTEATPAKPATDAPAGTKAAS